MLHKVQLLHHMVPLKFALTALSLCRAAVIHVHLICDWPFTSVLRVPSWGRYIYVSGGKHEFGPAGGGTPKVVLHKVNFGSHADKAHAHCDSRHCK